MLKSVSLKRCKFFVNAFIKKIGRDHISAFSAQTTFFLLISFFPFLIIFITLTQYLHLGQNDVFLQLLSSLVPQEIVSMIATILHDIYSKTGTVLSFSLLTLLWSASRGINALTNCFNNICNINENRNYFIIRFFAIIYTVIFALILFLSIAILVFGSQIYAVIAKWLPNSFVMYIADNIMHIRSAVGVTIFFAFFTFMYKFLPNKKITFKQTIPGAVFSTLGWLVMSYVFSIYVGYISRFSYIYGSLSGVIIALLWLYFCIYIIFIGAEINYFWWENYFVLKPQKIEEKKDVV